MEKMSKYLHKKSKHLTGCFSLSILVLLFILFQLGFILNLKEIK